MEIPQFPIPDAQEKKWAVIIHLSPFVGYLVPLAGFIAPVVIWMLKRTESQFLDHQGKEVVNFMISYLCYLAVAGVLCFILIGIPLIFMLWIASMILMIIGAVRASEGVFYRYPYIFRLVA